MREYIIRKRGMNSYLDRWRGFREEIPHAHIFPSVEEAQFSCDQVAGSPGELEICELTGEGGVQPLQPPPQ